MAPRSLAADPVVGISVRSLVDSGWLARGGHSLDGVRQRSFVTELASDTARDWRDCD
jgi:hypothetical protein